MRFNPEDVVQNRADKLALIVEVPAGKCAIPLDQVVETLRPLPIESLAGIPDRVSGVALIRGTPVPVVDLGAVFAGSPQSPGGRWVTVRTGERTVALSVERVIGIAEIPPSTLGTLPPLLKSGCADAIEAMGNLDRDLLVTLSLARLVPDSVWQALEPGEPSR
jgi:purine-binding chemotaxis protein CheW